MDKEKLMALFSEAIDKKANITIHFGQYCERKPVTNEEAFDLAHRFMDALQAPGIKKEEGVDTKRYIVNHGQFSVCMSYIPSETEEQESKRNRIEHLKRELAKLENEEVGA